MLDNFSPHLSTKTDSRVGDWADANNVELAYVPFYASWMNRIEAQFTGLRYFALDGTDHPDHATQARLIRRYIAWRNYNVELFGTNIFDERNQLSRFVVCALCGVPPVSNQTKIVPGRPRTIGFRAGVKF